MAPQKMPRTEPVRPSVIASPVAMRAALLGRCGLREPNATGASLEVIPTITGVEVTGGSSEIVVVRANGLDGAKNVSIRLGDVACEEVCVAMGEAVAAGSVG